MMLTSEAGHDTCNNPLSIALCCTHLTILMNHLVVQSIAPYIVVGLGDVTEQDVRWLVLMIVPA